MNGRGQPLSSTDPNGIVTNYTYDLLGRLKTVTVSPGTGAAVTTLTYDAAGNITQIQAPDGSTWWGVGMDSSILDASLSAVVGAANRARERSHSGAG